MNKLKYLVLGILFGIILIKSEAVSWFRIHEMFLFQSFHMYGIIGSAVIIGAISILLIKKFKIKTISGEEIVIVPKEFTKGTVFGGLIFGLGWAMTGACPGPLYALVGSGAIVIAVVLFSAILGTYVYALLKDKLPH
ncbi:MAG: YeeE/YedE family protein [Bacteroidetes bacterium]|nr:YeeE/YedE family protein [Bacteroidota bacterium]